MSEAPQRRTGLVISAVLVAVVAATVIVVWGLVALPAFTPFGEPSGFEVPGTVAFLVSDRGEAATCVSVVGQAEPRPRELRCYPERDARYPESLGWTDDGRIVVTLYGERGAEYEVLDRSSADVSTTGTWDEAGPGTVPRPDASPGADGVTVRREGGRVVVTNRIEGATVTLIDAEAPASYDFWEQRWSPGRGYLLLVDSEQRLVVVPSDGSSPAMLLAEDVRAPAWWMPELGADAPVDLPAKPATSG